MRLDIIKTVIAIAVCGLIAYGFFTFSTSSEKNLLTIGSLIFLIITLVLTIGIHLNLPRTTALIKTVSAIFFILAFLSNLIFSFVDFKEATYIIANGILFLIYALVAYSIGKAKQ